MTDEKLGEIFNAYAQYYWSVPVEYAIDKIAERHPEIKIEQVERVLNQTNTDIFRYHFWVEFEGLEELELAAEHLVALDRGDYERFLAVRADLPCCDCDEETLFSWTDGEVRMPEAKEILKFGKTELGLDDEWARQLVEDCIFCLPTALCEGKSWVMEVLNQETFGKIRFRTVKQVARFRELGNSFYQVMPNPVLRGWRPKDIEDPPLLNDDIPEKDSDIPDNRDMAKALFSIRRSREKTGLMLTREEKKAKRKIGRNEPCPCGSGKKYKKCCGR